MRGEIAYFDRLSHRITVRRSSPVRRAVSAMFSPLSLCTRVTSARVISAAETSPALALGPRMPLLGMHTLSGAAVASAGLGVFALGLGVADAGVGVAAGGLGGTISSGP